MRTVVLELKDFPALKTFGALSFGATMIQLLSQEFGRYLNHTVETLLAIEPRSSLIAVA